MLVNNASDFFPTDIDEITVENYDKLFNSNVKGPLFYGESCFSLLKKSQNIINLVDIHADKPLKRNIRFTLWQKAANK